MSVEVQNPLPSHINGDWHLILDENENPQQQPPPRKSKHILTTVETTVVDNYSKEIAPNTDTTVKDTLPKEFVAVSSDNKQQKENEPAQVQGWWTYLLSSLSSWLVTQSKQPLASNEGTTSSEELWGDWEWVLSKTEEFTVKQMNEDGKRVREELYNLRRTANALQLRQYFYEKHVKPTLARLCSDSQLENDLKADLDSSKVSKIISDVVNTMQNKWLEVIKSTFFHDVEVLRWQLFVENYPERPYERNVVGSLKELAFSAALGTKKGGLSEKVLVDILWSIWKTLTEVVRAAVQSDSSPEKFFQLADSIAEAKDLLVKLWVDTVRVSRNGRSREGQLIQKWKEEQDAEETRMCLLKQRGADAKWFDEERLHLDDKYRDKPTCVEGQVDMKRIKKFLEKNLAFPTKVEL